jgi:hypothetical protein
MSYLHTNLAGVNKCMISTVPVIFDFDEFGQPGIWPVDIDLVQLYLRAAIHMVNTYSPAALELSCELLTQGLQEQSLDSDSPSDEWIGNAVLVTAIRGVLGTQIPPIIS